MAVGVRKGVKQIKAELTFKVFPSSQEGVVHTAAFNSLGRAALEMGILRSAQWYRTHLPGQKMQVQSLSQNIPYIRNWQPTPVFLPEEPHGPGSLVGYSSCGCKESDTTEQLNIRNRKLYWAQVNDFIGKTWQKWWSFIWAPQNKALPGGERALQPEEVLWTKLWSYGVPWDLLMPSIGP